MMICNDLCVAFDFLNYKGVYSLENCRNDNSGFKYELLDY